MICLRFACGQAPSPRPHLPDLRHGTARIAPHTDSSMKVLAAIGLLIRIAGAAVVIAIGAELFWHEYGKRIAQAQLPNGKRVLLRTTARRSTQLMQLTRVVVTEFYYSEGRLPDQMDAAALGRGGGRPEDCLIVGLGLLRFDVQSDEGRHIPLYLQATAGSPPLRSVNFRCVYNDVALQNAAQWLPGCTYDPNFNVGAVPFGRRAASLPIRNGIVPVAVRRYYFEPGRSGIADVTPDDTSLPAEASADEHAKYNSRPARDLLALIEKNPDADFEIAVVGFTDMSGYSLANQRLSEQRALTVRDVLIQNGVSPTLINVTGGGELDATNDCSRITKRPERSICLRDARRVEVRLWRNDR
jgi:hypothetical protein